MFKYKSMSLTLKSVAIENFKCFGKFQEINFEKLTILTGANSSGKSAIFHSILGCFQSLEFPFKFSPNGKFINMGDFKEISYKQLQKDITLNFKFHNNKKNFYLQTTWVKNKINSLPELNFLRLEDNSNQLEIYQTDKQWFYNYKYDKTKDPEFTPENEKMTKENMLNSFTMITQRDEESKTFQRKFKGLVNTVFKTVRISNQKIKNIENFDQEIYKKNNFQLRYFSDIFLKRLNREFDENMNLISSFRLQPDRTYLELSKRNLKIDKSGEGYIDQIVSWERDNKIQKKYLEELMKDFGLVHSIKAHRIEGGRYEVMVTTKENGTETSIFDVGFGIGQFLPIIVADLQLSKNSTLFIAEPEIHLHPDVQSKFGEYIVKQITNKESEKNYIIETHSEYFLNRIRLEIVKGNLNEKDVAVYYLENDGNDVKIHKLLFGKKGQIEGVPNSFFDTYLMDIRDIALNID